MPSFEIPDSPANVKLQSSPPGTKTPRTGSIVFNVTNRAATATPGRLSVQTAGQAKQDWFAIDGDKERSFAPGETQTISIKIAIPPEVAAGDYSFRLRVVSVNDPDNDHTAGPASVAHVEGAASPRPDPTPIWPFIVAGIILLLIVGGGVGWYVMKHRSKDEGGTKTGATAIAVPALTGLKLADARTAAKDFTLKENAIAPTGAAVGTILDQSPAKDTPAKKGDSINVYFDPGVQVPAIRGETIGDAVQKLRSASLDNSVLTTCGAGPLNSVGGQDPAAGQMAPKGSQVKVYVIVQQTSGDGPLATRVCAHVKLTDAMLREVARGSDVFSVVNRPILPHP